MVSLAPGSGLLKTAHGEPLLLEPQDQHRLGGQGQRGGCQNQKVTVLEGITATAAPLMRKPRPREATQVPKATQQMGPDQGPPLLGFISQAFVLGPPHREMLSTRTRVLFGTEGEDQK